MELAVNRPANERRWRETIAFGVLIGGFSIGAVNHARDFLMLGWRPYSGVPLLLEAFWTALVLLDVAAVALLSLGRRRVGLTLAIVIMILDVSANAYASWFLKIPGFEVALPIQAAFLGFVVGSTILLWPARTYQP